jgi:hypothetical protein
MKRFQNVLIFSKQLPGAFATNTQVPNKFDEEREALQRRDQNITARQYICNRIKRYQITETGTSMLLGVPLLGTG